MNSNMHIRMFTENMHCKHLFEGNRQPGLYFSGLFGMEAVHRTYAANNPTHHLLDYGSF